MADEAAIKKDLEQASAGLLYPSESDTPFDAFCWNPRSTDAAAELVARTGSARKIEEVSVDQFFSQLKDADDAAKFMQLKLILQSHLTGLKVLRLGAGEIEVEIYLIGKTPGGDWAGLHTQSVET